jgi:hypothetical protein
METLPTTSEYQYNAAVGAFDQALLEHLDRHLVGEQQLLDEYRLLAESSDPPVAYIAQLILEDEEHHHRVLTEMRNYIRTSAWSLEHSPRVPWMTKSADPTSLRRTVRRLCSFERRDLRELRKLNRRLGFLRHSSLNGALVQALELDTRKHLHYLHALARLTRRRR